MSGFSLFCAGQEYQKGTMPLHTDGKEFHYGQMPLYANAPTPTGISGEMPLFVGGTTSVSTGSLSLHTINTFLIFDPNGGSDLTLDDIQVNLFLEGKNRIDGEVFGHTGSVLPRGLPALPLHVRVGNGDENNSLSLYTDGFATSVPSSNQLSLFTFSLDIELPIEKSLSSSLYISGEVSQSITTVTMPLVLMGRDIANIDSTSTVADTMSLYVSQGYSFVWDSYSFGENVDVDDEQFISIDPTDGIRGVELICYGSCDTGTCEDLILQSHDTTWFSVDCLDGGIFRAENTYTNLEENAFGSSVPYSGHFYGVRKFTGLEPLSSYAIEMKGFSGSGIRIPAPKELNSWEYTNPNNVDAEGAEGMFSGIKLIGDEPYVDGGRNEGDRYGNSVSMTQDLLAIGAPKFDLENTPDILDGSDITLENAGTVFVYKRGAEPASDDLIASNKAGWDFEEQLILPSSIRRDHYEETVEPLVGTDATITKRKWHLGQEGRNFGHSLATCIIDNKDLQLTEKPLYQDDKELIVVGGPDGNWSRTFADITFEQNEILLLVFTDEFSPSVNGKTYHKILENITQQNLLYKYYSQPAIDITIKVIIFQPMDFALQEDIDFPEPKPQFITKKSITRHTNDVNGTVEFSNKDDEILNGIKDAFFEVYPTASTMPAILGVYVDNSRSLGTAAIEPALSRFKDFYQSHVFNSGLLDHFDQPSSGAILSTTTDDEDWITQSNALLEFTLDSGRLYKENYLELLTDPEEFGKFNTNVPQFNEPPASGGSVYLFEKESGTWNLIQELKSPTLNTDIAVDHFGKSVDISKNGEVIIVGSPYIDEAVSIYEYDYSEKDRLYSNVESWIDYHVSQGTNDDVYPNLKFNLDALKLNFPEDEDHENAFRSIYTLLSKDQKYFYRTDKDFWSNSTIQEYKKIYEYKYSDISYEGTYKKILEKFAPTSRMGYSVAINESGTSFAVGCPTDSLDESDDSNAYYHPTNSGQILWPSHVNAGAVRVFDARKYFPHSKVVEYRKFGNATTKFIPENSEGFYPHYSGIYEDIDKKFIITDFNDFEIPEDAGVLFIICPEINFVNISVMSRIQKWLSLGDRNLILVGNNSTFEQQGAYFESNNIINNILDYLDSSMKLAPAIGVERSLLNSETCKDIPNIIPVDPPQNSIKSYIDSSSSMFGRGVANIVANTPNVPNDSDYFANVNQVMYEEYTCDSYYTQHNNYCSPPLRMGEDLRASWSDENGLRNWPNLFNDVFLGSREPPVPLLSAAEVKEPFDLTIPAVPARSGLFTVFDSIQTDVAPVFGNIINPDVKDILWTSDENNYLDLNINIGNNSNPKRFFDPSEKFFVNPVLQSEASNGVETIKTDTEVESAAHFASEENYPNTKSSVFLISSLRAELLDKLYSGGDRNINFYFNIVAKNQFGNSNIAQLNAFSGRSNFTDAIAGSALELIFTNNGNNVNTNVSMSQLINGNAQGQRYHVCWVANPLNVPTQEEIGTLKTWLSTNNKKLIITYDNSDSAHVAKVLCEALDLTMSPLYLPQRKRFANNRRDLPSNSRFYSGRGNQKRFVNISDNHFVRNGFNSQRDSISKLTVDVARDTFIPISLGAASSVASVNHGISDDKYIDVGFHFIKSGTCKVDFAVQPNTAYRVFFEAIAFSNIETESLKIYITNCSAAASFGVASTPPSQNILNWNNDNDFNSVFEGPVGIIGNIKHQKKFRNTESFEFKTLPGVDHVSIYIEGNNPRISSSDSSLLPSTLALSSISGCAISIDEANVFEKVPRYEWRVITQSQPAETVTVTFDEPIPFTSDSSNNCPTDECREIFKGTQIEDGPVVVAQEIYYGGDHSEGINRSRITVISDADLIQGDCIFDQDGKLRSSHKDFITSLYPDTVFPSNINARIFDTNQKIVSMERGSPSRYYNAVGYSDLVGRFVQDQGTPSSGLLMQNFRDVPDTSISRAETITDANETSIFSAFIDSQDYFSSNSKFNQNFSGTLYSDASILGGMPEVMKDHGVDFLDFRTFPSGYPGDLFGHSLAYYNGHLVIGAPFAAYDRSYITPWAEVSGNTSQYEHPSGIVLSKYGGAGSVYIYNNTGNGSTPFGNTIDWALTQKIRPDTINVGQDVESVSAGLLDEALGQNNYDLDFLLEHSPIPDKFGYSVDLHGDVIAVGAPGHDYSVEIETTIEGAFAERFFNFEFDIVKRIGKDLGDPETRLLLGIASGVLNNGAIFTFENRFGNKISNLRNWEYVEKLLPQGHSARVQQTVAASGTENENFGEALSIYRAKRRDADYTVAIGTPYHKFATSGNHITPEPLSEAGAATTFDAMLRINRAFSPATGTGAFIDSRVYGMKGYDVDLYIDNTDLDSEYYANGIVYSNNQGEIFVEASGQDLNSEGFSIHRPYIQSVLGSRHKFQGEEENGNLSLYTFAVIGKDITEMPLYLLGASEANVYNSLGIFVNAMGLENQNTLPLFVTTGTGTQIDDDEFSMFVSGVGIPSDQLNLITFGW
tara:strand:+ start:56420 stop:63889 length:7470 start_codon:yes stop_codon:yes gene_type:complete